MKIKYTFVEKITLLADQHHKGKLLLHRKLEGGIWKSRMTITSANQQPSLPSSMSPLTPTGLTSPTSITVVNNGDETIFIGTIDQAAKKLNIKVDWVPHIITHNVDFKLTTTGEWRVTVTEDVLGPINIKVAASQNLKDIDIVAEYKNKNYAFVKLTGDGVTPTVMQDMVPSKLNEDPQTSYHPSNSLLHRLSCM